MGMSPALCEQEFFDDELCAVVAVGRCHQCGFAFCESHRAADYSTLCGACLDERRNVQAAKWAEARRREQRHAAAVAAREQKTGWAQLREEVEMIDEWLASSGPGGREVTRSKAIFAAVLGIGAIALLVPVARAENLAPVLALLAGFLVWSGWTVTRKHRQHQRRRWRLERNRLLQARGCGVQGCAMCARNA